MYTQQILKSSIPVDTAPCQKAWRSILDNETHGIHPILQSLDESLKERPSWEKVLAPFQFDTYVVLGTGGASLGGRTLARLKAKSKVQFVESVDPHTLEALFTTLDPKTTGCIAISKSGETSETLAQFSLFYTWLESHLDGRAKDHFLVVTTQQESTLMAMAQSLEIPTIPHPSTVGGRFSLFTTPGMIPSLLDDTDVDALIRGAKHTLDHPDLALDGAAFCHAHQSYPCHVFMVYGDRLDTFGLWFRQLWAESLGKDGKGAAPLLSHGPVDQHSQLQLFADGPDDKFYTMVALNSTHKGARIKLSENTKYAIPDHLLDRPIGDLMMAEYQATCQSLVRCHRPLRQIILPSFGPEVLGALLMQQIVEVVLLAEMMGVDAFSQPGVEESKMLTRAFLKTGSS